jgi:succinate dehydrogenase/fumarate reductase flavoprotein subunit
MKVVDTDILIIGGGIAGCFAALSASKVAKSVTLLEKSTIKRGGAVGPGMDHIQPGIGSPIPGSPTPEMELERAQSKKMRENLKDPNIYLSQAREGYDRLKDWESFGVKIREDDGSYALIWIPERPDFSQLYIRGADMKIRQGEAVHKRPNIHVLDRVMGVDLLTHDGTVTGGVGFNTRTGEITAYLSKATILSTGAADRQYINPDGLFLTYNSPASAGDGQAIAYRAGAEIINAEFAHFDYTTCRDGGGIFGVHAFEKMPILRNRLGEKVLKNLEDSAKRGTLMVKEITEGRGPLYFDASEMPEDEFRLMDRSIDHEYPITRKWYKERCLELRKDLIPNQIFMTAIGAQILADENCRTSMKGLYVAGQTGHEMGSLFGASVSGHRAGEVAVRDALKAKKAVLDEEQAQKIEKVINAPLAKRDGVDCTDLEEAVRGINTDYVGYYRSEGMMQKGLELLLKHRKIHLPNLYAKNPHELMRCLEVRNIFDISEMHIRASLMRKETRPIGVGMTHLNRVDYPDTDPAWEKWIVVKKEDGEMNLSTREIPGLKESLKREIEEEIRRRG